MQAPLDFGGHVAQGDGGGPRIIIGDQSEIPLMRPSEAPVLDHRMALLARDEDIVVLRAPDAAFVNYTRDVLGKRSVTWLSAGNLLQGPVARACRKVSHLREPLEALVARAPGTTLYSYMTTGRSWRLAQSLGEATAATVHVAGPGPRIGRRSNNKLWFSELAQRVLGSASVPPTMRAFGPAATAALVRRMARESGRVVVKVPDSAGSAGNIRIDRADLADVPLAVLRRFLVLRLRAIGWQGRYPLLVGVWDSNVVCSPSVQMWLPKIESGPPRVDGVFEQRVRGLEAAFVGAQPTTLPSGMQTRLAHEAMRIASVLQRLGYFGRCSFDAVLVRGPGSDLVPHWIECNGRWGGVSIPMTAAAMLTGRRTPGGIVIVQSGIDAPPVSTTALLALLEPLLYRPGSDPAGIVVLAPPRDGSDVTMMAMAPEQDEAERMMQAALKRLRR